MHEREVLRIQSLRTEPASSSPSHRSPGHGLRGRPEPTDPPRKPPAADPGPGEADLNDPVSVSHNVLCSTPSPRASGDRPAHAAAPPRRTRRLTRQLCPRRDDADPASFLPEVSKRKTHTHTHPERSDYPGVEGKRIHREGCLQRPRGSKGDRRAGALKTPEPHDRKGARRGKSLRNSRGEKLSHVHYEIPEHQPSPWGLESLFLIP